MPIGMLISDAIATITSVPTIALPKPPPSHEAGGRQLGEQGRAQPGAAAR